MLILLYSFHLLSILHFTLKGFFAFFGSPNVLGWLSLVSFLLVSEGCYLISISFFEVSCQSYVSFNRYAGCDSSLLYNVVCKVLYFEGA